MGTTGSRVAKMLMALTDGPDPGPNGVVTDESGQFWGDFGAGCLFVAEDTGRILFSYRSIEVNEPHTWGVWGGAGNHGESPDQVAEREAREELKYTGPMTLVPTYVYQKDGFQYTTFLAFVPREFTPRLDWETEDYMWVDPSFTAWPQPLHYGLKAAEPAIQQKLDTWRKKRRDAFIHTDAFFQSFI